MNEQSPRPYAFGDGIPLNAAPPGTTLFGGGEEINAAEDLALSLAADPETVGTIDCSGTAAVDPRAAAVETVSSPRTCPAPGSSSRGSTNGSTDRRSGSSGRGSSPSRRSCTYNELRTVFRFFHSITSRISGVNGLGVFVLDPAAHDDRTNIMLARLSDALLAVGVNPRQLGDRHATRRCSGNARERGASTLSK
jgi:hypothetical protein